ncbi:hypothetical protein COZ22_02320 [bacterium (Candidatus Howlettbacteria) CG_4_10_14_3_um_filter_37_10]|nr:MAG: hypothetical protein COX25_00530 [bacterium (Candidatus Howlettbacteria) CG23_combo_of_CG06-09_8_20_14_all_37_9]PIX99543.1 MAG: hypothetical protein COZ22_02320 [bacterium (Candidatus Howlettbacteria) CG_4_10_14_3_um_filter_37_10]
MNQLEIGQLAKRIWDYHHVNQQLKKADCIMVMGSNDIRVAKRGAELFLEGWAPWIVFSGGVGKLTEHLFKKPEAEVFADIALEMGVSREKILIENTSTNIGGNIECTRKLLEEKGIKADSFIIVQKPFMERRAYATFKKLWPEKEFIVTSPQIPFEECASEFVSKEDCINIMVGDLQRIKIYPEKGFQIYQEIPEDVWGAFEELVRLGYTGHLVK